MTDRIQGSIGLLIADALLAGACYMAAYLVRVEADFLVFYLPVMAKTAPVVIAVSAGSFYFTGLYRSLPRYASVDTLVTVARSTTVAVALAALAIFIAWRGVMVPRSVFVIQWMLIMLLMGGVRMLPRLRPHHLFMPLSAARSDREHVLVYGAGYAGQMAVREMLDRDDSPYWPAGFIDDDPTKQGRTLHGRPVLGTGDDLERIVAESGVDEIFVAIPSATGPELRRVVECCQAVPGVTVKTLPGISDLLEGRVSVQQFHEVRIEDLLKRTPRDLEPERVREFIQGKAVLVTGAGGSIGSELCRQIAACKPARLVLFEQSEFNLYTIHREIRDDYPDFECRAALGDASHRPSVEPVIQSTRPEIIFHAAAYKHVPLLEENPCEGVLNNVLGVANTAQAAAAAGVDTFVFVSTDKAVRPVSVMGAAKRVGEIYVQLMAERSNTRFCVVRFGNVLGSSGSVIPRFSELIREGRPVTVTHPDASRYFMLTSEAVQLVMQAASLGRSGDIFVLDMGEPVQIEDLARDLARLMGVTKNGVPQIEIAYTGLRPGEKIEEELLLEPTDECPTGYESIMVEGHPTPVGWEALQAGIQRLVNAARSGDVTHTILALHDVVPEYEPATPRYAEIVAADPQPRVSG